MGQINVNQNPKISIKGRYKTKVESTPGPADFCPDPLPGYGNPSSTIRGSKKIQQTERVKTANNDTPGPADFTVKTTLTKSTGPSYSLRKRLDASKGIQF
jgi:hypothetical protein